MKTCDFCGATLEKGRRRFCSNKHKDKFHNRAKQQVRYAHPQPSDPQWNEYDEFDGSWDAHNC